MSRFFSGFETGGLGFTLIPPTRNFPSMQRMLDDLKGKIQTMEKNIKQAFQAMGICLCIAASLIFVSCLFPKNAMWIMLMIKCLGVGVSVIFVVFTGVISALTFQCDAYQRQYSSARHEIAIEQERRDNVRRQVLETSRALEDNRAVFDGLQKLRTEVNNLFAAHSMLPCIPSIPKDSRWTNDPAPECSTKGEVNKTISRGNCHGGSGVKDSTEATSIGRAYSNGSRRVNESPVDGTKDQSRTNFSKKRYTKLDVAKPASDSCLGGNDDKGLKKQNIAMDHAYCHGSRRVNKYPMNGNLNKSRTYLSKKHHVGDVSMRSEKKVFDGKQQTVPSNCGDLTVRHRNVFVPTRLASASDENKRDSLNISKIWTKTSREESARKHRDENILSDLEARLEIMVSALLPEDKAVADIIESAAQETEKINRQLEELFNQKPQSSVFHDDPKSAACGLEHRGSDEVEDTDCLTPKRQNAIGLTFQSRKVQNTECTVFTPATASRTRESMPNQDGQRWNPDQGDESCATGQTDRKLQEEDVGFECVVRLNSLPPGSPYHMFDSLNGSPEGTG